MREYKFILINFYGTASPFFTKDQIRSIIAQKDWYDLDPETGSFNWNLSLIKLGKTFGLNPNILDQLITNCYGPDCLIKANENGTEDERPLIDILLSKGIVPHIWTVGDQSWQRTKFERVGLLGKIPDSHYHCANQRKEEELRKIFEHLNNKGKKSFLVVDDKGENIEKIKKIAQNLGEKGITVLDFHFKKDDPQANGTAFLKWLADQLAQYPELEIFLDFDGVIADTDGVLFGPVVEAIYEII